jgi:hypothetical protein
LDWWSHAHLNFLIADFIRHSKQNFAPLSFFINKVSEADSATTAPAEVKQ